MSGQPNRYAADAAKFRQDYMNALDLRSALDDQVLQAVKIYKQTGQVPAISTMTDNRTNEERLRDNEGLKMKILAELKPLGDAQFCQGLLQRIIRSPYNTDGSFFAFIAQRISGIVKNLSGDYGMGSGSSSGFIERIAGLMEDLYAKDKAMATTTKSYFDRPSNTPVGGITAGDLTTLRQQYEQIIPKILAGAHKTGDANITAIATNVRNKFEAISTFMNTDRYKLITARIQQLTSVNAANLQIPGNHNPGIGAREADVARLYDIYNDYNDLLKDLPSPTKLATMLLQLDKSTTNANNDLTRDILIQIDSLLPEQQRSGDIQVAIDRYAQEFGFEPMGGLRPYGRRLTRREASLLGPRPVEPVIPTPVQAGLVIPAGTAEDIKQWARNLAATEPPGGRSASAILYSVPGMSLNPQALGAYTQLRFQGEGIHQEKRRRGRPKGCGIKVPFSEKVDSSQGVQASPRYISFGKHVINKKKLGDGILSIRTKSGANIASSPVKHISQNMKIVVDKIIGGTIPSYEELSRLTDEEKAYLHKVSKQADILDKFSIPAPSKDQEEKEIHEYEVMRGEIMSGNDNKELIKKFKLLIIKLSRRNALPKKEVSDILSELVELGY